MRGLLLLAFFILAAIALSYVRRTWRRGLPPRGGHHDELVKDPVCQTYVVMSRAVRSEAGGAPTYFCSRECAARFARGERRA